MEKTRLEAAIENAREAASEQDNDIRTLKDLELLLVGGGGDDVPHWG